MTPPQSCARSHLKAAPSYRKFGAPPEIPNPILPKALNAKETAPGIIASRPSRYRQAQSQAAGLMPDPLWSFDGVSNLFGGWPPDTQGDIGPDHYVQWINLHFAIWELDKINHTATLVYGPAAGNTLFSGFGGECEFNNDGDPITLYDPFADRWFMSQFALPNYPNGPFYQCMAVSATPDPTGAWYRYEFQMPVNKMNDYPKFGVWPDAYYMTVNQFNAGTLSWGGAGVAALEREAMLNGSPARMVFFDLYGVNPNFSGILPADFDGINQPPLNSPGYFAEWDDSSWIGPQDALRVWKFQIDWLNPEAATFGIGRQPNWVIPTQDVDPSMCGMARNCIPQPGTTNRLDAISDRLMYRLQYRNFGGYETLVSNHTVDVDGSRPCRHPLVRAAQRRPGSGLGALPGRRLCTGQPPSLDGQPGDGPCGRPGAGLQRLQLDGLPVGALYRAAGGRSFGQPAARRKIDRRRERLADLFQPLG